MMCVRESECEGAGIFIYYNFCHVRIPRLGGDTSGRLKYANTSLSILRTLVFQSCVCACVRHVCVKINAFFHVGENKGEIAKESKGARAREMAISTVVYPQQPCKLAKSARPGVWGEAPRFFFFFLFFIKFLKK